MFQLAQSSTLLVYGKRKSKLVYNKLRTNKFLGFTLIELLVVISIIAILSTVGVALFTGVSSKARDSKRKQDVIAISKALEAGYSPTLGQYPAIVGSLFADGTVPKDPSTNQPYSVTPSTLYTTPTNTGFQICATLENPPNQQFCKPSSQIAYVAPPPPAGPPPAGPPPPPGPPASPEFLGNPFKARYSGNDLGNGVNDSFYRNVWAVKFFSGSNKIYLGTGDSANNAGDLNAGAAGPGIDIWTFDPTTSNFSTESPRLTTEEVEDFRIVNAGSGNQLQVTAWDPTPGSSNDNDASFWRRSSNGNWGSPILMNPIPAGNAQHTFDVYPFGGKWFGGLGPSASTTSDDYVISSSADGTSGWTNPTTCNNSSGSSFICDSSERTYFYFEIPIATGGTALYANTPNVLDTISVRTNLLRYMSGTTFQNVSNGTILNLVSPLTGSAAQSPAVMAMYYRAKIYNNFAVYVAAAIGGDAKQSGYAVKKVQETSAGVLGTVGDITPAADVGKIYKPWDLIVSGSDLFVLGEMCPGTQASASGGSVCSTGITPIITVHKETNSGTIPSNGSIGPNGWTEVLRFNGPSTDAFARSFEYVPANTIPTISNGYFYLGMISLKLSNYRAFNFLVIILLVWH